MSRILVCLFLFIANCACTRFQDCGSSAKVRKVEVSDCPDDQTVCNIEKGLNKTMTLHFKAKKAATQVDWAVHGRVGAIQMKVPLPETDACKHGLPCPVVAGRSYVINGTMRVATWYPPVYANVTVKLVDENKRDIVCVVLKCKIAPALGGDNSVFDFSQLQS